MAEKSCWTCLRFTDCDRVRSKGRKYRLWNAPHRLFDFYRQTAENCRGWTEDNATLTRMVLNELMSRITRSLKVGKIVALNNGTGFFSFRGEYDSEADAQASINGDKNIMLLYPHPPQKE